MGSIGDRIREERERLSLSQADFAKAAGVHRRSQTNYELGKRSPDADYLAAIGGIGVDVFYVTMGLRYSNELIRALANGRILCYVAEACGIDLYKLSDVVDEAEKDELKVKHGQSLDDDPARVYRLTKELIEPAINKLQEINPDLLSQVMEEIEHCLAKASLTLPTSKKARAIAMLYRAFRANGKIDPKMVEDAVSLAAE